MPSRWLGSIEIDLDALHANHAQLVRLAAPARVVPVVKSNAYGHGLALVSRALGETVDTIAVFRLGEAAELREAGFRGRIMLLGPADPSELDEAAALDATIALWDVGGYLRDVARSARRRGRPMRANLKIDTGLGRFGVAAALAGDALATFLGCDALAPQGVYTHLAAAEELDGGYTAAQLHLFETTLAPLADELHRRGIERHAAASAAAMLVPASRLDLVRAGIALYGIWPSAATHASIGATVALRPALSLHTSVVVVREVPAGEAIGYGCTFVTERPSRIGLLPLGYAEGIPRALSGRGAVAVAGRRAPIVGRVCMNVTFVDLTDVPHARVGSRVTLIGRDGDASVWADEWAQWCGTIAYEILARLPNELERIPVTAALP